MSDRALSDAELLKVIRVVFQENRGYYGAPRVHDALFELGHCVSRKRVARLMRESGLCAKTRKKYKHTTDSNHNLPIAPNLLDRNFTVATPNAVYVSDITCLRTGEGWLYLAVIIDLYSRRVVGWSLSDRMTAKLVCDALDMAVRQRHPTAGLLFHSDRGSQYASKRFRKRLARYGMRQSMSRRGNCWDNSVAESFFGTLKKELVRGVVFISREVARADVFEYIEVFYNRKRIHTKLGKVSPHMFEENSSLLLAA